jgi:hypothetical protein
LAEANELRRFLRKHPHPTKIRAYSADDDEKVIHIGVSRSKWRDAEEACSGYVKLEALNSEGEILRLFEIESEEEYAVSESGAKKGADPNILLMREFAGQIAQAYDSGAVRYKDLVNLAFDQNAVLIGVLSGRLQALEKAWHQLLMSQPEKLEGDPNAAMITSLLTAAAPGLLAGMAGKMNGPTPPTNGKKP